MSCDSIRQLVQRAAHSLPAQGPITAFVHHNTLHAFEHLPFEHAVETAARTYGCQPYLSEERYRTKLETGKIQSTDLDRAVQEELGAGAEEPVAGLVTRTNLLLAMLNDPVRIASEAELRWVVAVGGGLRRFRRRSQPLVREQVIADTRQWVMRELRGGFIEDAGLQAMAREVVAPFGEKRIEYWSHAIWQQVALAFLWRACARGMRGLPAAHEASQVRRRLRDAFLTRFSEDPDLLVHETLIRFCSAFADQGFAGWSPPGRTEGFLRSFLTLYGSGHLLRESWLRRFPAEAARIVRDGLTAEQSIEQSFEEFGVTVAERETFVKQSLLALRGWAGMLWQLESRPDRAHRPMPEGTLVEFLAVRLILDRLAVVHLASRALGSSVSLGDVRRRLAGHSRTRGDAGALAEVQRAYIVFQLAQMIGWTPRILTTLAKQQWAELAHEIESFPSLRRRKVFHRAFERRHRIQQLDAIANHRGTPRPEAPRQPTMQVVCCIDEREESFRRHLEEVDPHVETFGVAGFFGVAMYYRGIWDSHDTPLCPVSLRPKHRVVEQVRVDHQTKYANNRVWTRRFARAAIGLHKGSRGVVGGLLATLFGATVAVPLVARILFPRLAARLRRRAGSLVKSTVPTDLSLERDPAVTAGKEQIDSVLDGFTVEEMARIVETVLRDIGMARNFARLVVWVGHGSSSLNNPHEAAHDCGACGGGRGGPNARVIARMANHNGVRDLLANAGLPIPSDTIFLGAYHNTCDDSVVYYDTGELSPSHDADFLDCQAAMETACDRNAHERCRRFRSCSVLASPKEARRHVEARAEDLAQPRPEFGHATNAICVVGRRRRSRGLFLDRRAFLASYDPESDEADESSPVLTRVLEAVVPVCAGINLEYYFSYVDPTGWGCGTKLPHNIVSLVGVMDGTASDLRPGLPWQMVEIHESVRLMLCVETTPARLTRILTQSETLQRYCQNEWVWLAALDPHSSQIDVFEHGAFRPYTPESTSLPECPSSLRWYRGLREHLPACVIKSPDPETIEARPRR